MNFLKLAQLLPISFLLAGCSYKSIEHSNVIVTDKVEVIENELKNIDNDSLVIFDCDDTLIVSQDQISRDMQFLSNTQIEKEKFKNFEDIILLESKSVFVNPKIPEIIKGLQAKNVKTIVLTGMNHLECGQIKSRSDFRIEELKKKGLDFSGAFKNMPKTELKEHSPKIAPLYDRGVIFSGSSTKGETLTAFLNHLNIRPSKIVFIDDRMKHIKTVSKALTDLGVNYLCIHYLGEVHTKFDTPSSKKRLDYQLKILEKKKKYLSDSEAEKEMKKLSKN